MFASADDISSTSNSDGNPPRLWNSRPETKSTCYNISTLFCHDMVENPPLPPRSLEQGLDAAPPRSEHDGKRCCNTPRRSVRKLKSIKKVFSKNPKRRVTNVGQSRSDLADQNNPSTERREYVFEA